MSTIRVGSGFRRKDLFTAVTTSRPGDVLVLDPGTYEVPDGFTIGSLVLTGAGDGVVLETRFDVTGQLTMSNLTLRAAAFHTAIHVSGPQARVELENVDIACDPTASYVGIWVDRGSLAMTGCRIWTSPSKDDPLGTSILVEGSATLTGTHCGVSVVHLRGGAATLSNTVMGCLRLDEASRVTSRDVVQLGNEAGRRALMLAGESTCHLAALRATDAWTEGFVENAFLRVTSFLPAPDAETERLVVYTSGRGVVDAPPGVVDAIDAEAPAAEPAPVESAPPAPRVLTWRADGAEWSDIQSQLRVGDTLLLEEGEYTIPDVIVLDFDVQGKGRADAVRLTATLSAQDGTARSVSNLTLLGHPEHNRLSVTGGTEVALSSVRVEQQDAASYYAVNVDGGRLVMHDCEVVRSSDDDVAEAVRVADGELIATDSTIDSLRADEGGSARLSGCAFTFLAAIAGGRIDSDDEVRHRALSADRYACVALPGSTIDLNRVSSDDAAFAVNVEGGVFAATDVDAEDAYIRVDDAATILRLPDDVPVVDAEGNPLGRSRQASSDPQSAPPDGAARDEHATAAGDAAAGDARDADGESTAADDPMAEIDALLGLETVKKKIRTFLQTVEFNRAREAQGLRGVDMTLHSLFLGGPGTGKTTVARLLGRALAGAGVIPSSTFVEVDPEGLVSPNIGETAQKTRRVLESALGGVLFIDEAYGLYQDGGSTNYGQQAVDTILKFMEDHRREIVVIFAGYADKMQDFLGMNPGLRSRIPNEFEFADYTDGEIAELGLSMLAADGYTVDEELYRRIIRRKYASSSDHSNGRWIRNRNEELLKVLISRVVETGDEDTTTILDEDLHAFAGGDAAAKEARIDELLAELDGMLGLEPVKRFVRDLVVQVQADRRLAQAGVIPGQPAHHMVFEGGAGTGKTTVARIIGELFHCLGILERSNVTEVVPTRDLIGRYIGQTEKQTSQVIDQAMGGVLFIDEAYQLNDDAGRGNDFGPRALETLLTALENNRASFVAIFAGYTPDMERLLDSNPGLRSRVPHRIAFPDYTPEEVGIIAADRLAKSWEVDRDLVREIAAQRYRLLPAEEQGNARWARTFTERVEQAHRRWILEHDVSGGELVRIRDEVVESFRP